MRYYFSLAVSKTFSFFNFQKLDYDVSWCGFLWMYPVCGSLSSSWICRFIYFVKFGKFSSILPLNTFQFLLLSPFLLLTQILDFILVPEVPEPLFVYFVSACIFSVFQIGWFLLSDFKFTDSFLCLLCSAVEPIHRIFYFVYWLF